MNPAAAVAIAAVTAFVLSSVWYAVAAPIEARRLAGRAPARDRPSPLHVLLELGRSTLTASVITGLAHGMHLPGVGPTLLLALALWAGFPFVLLTGSVMWDKVPVTTAVVHGGDWLVKMLAMGTIVGVWL
ncbi:hypothetical protein HDA32_002713 [Spinactinospora alkalitolerans]|uniref:DUF1761 domain-containing protein n=1 Tax=Spinactinospora alkalitolerans TaxID=687207 RepID=A0A852TXP7_9ACTN|nr:DUF1761 domain-containing protein [Spinactinospora alkalitolerans]NYE47593.1 hypothetical protein [Spinactinospora alkalitolerans]